MSFSRFKLPKSINKFDGITRNQIVAAVIVEIFVLIAAYSWAGRYPFGPVNYGLGDAGWQLLSFYGSYWDILHGAGPSSVFFNWDFGLGAPFFPDWVNYAASPFLLLLWFFPRKALALGLTLITWLILVCAAAAMTLFISKLVPQTRFAWFWGVAWASGGWFWDYAIFRTMWLQGLVALPLLGLVVLWSLQRRHFYLSIAIVAFAWTGNYYTAFMASFAAGILCLALIVERGLTKEEWDFKGLLRLLTVGVIGGLLSAWTLIPTYLAQLESIPFGAGRPWPGVNPLTLIRTFFPGASVLYDTPNLFFGTLGIISLAIFFFSKSVHYKSKLVWLGTIVLLSLTMFVRPLALIWSLFDTPNGSWFRASFVLVFFLVIIAAKGFSTVKEEPLTTLFAAEAVPALLLIPAAIAQKGLNFGTISPIIIGIVGIAVGMTLVAALRQSKQILATGATVLLLLTFTAEVAVQSMATAEFQTKFLASVPYRGELADRLRAEVGHSTGLERVGYFDNAEIPWNQGPLYGVTSTSYSSSLTPRPLGVDLPEMYGFPTTAGGRMVRTGEDPIASLLSAASTIVQLNGDDFKAVPIQAVPFARNVPADLAIPAGDPFAAREALLGTKLSTPVVSLQVANRGEDPVDIDLNGGFHMEKSKTIRIAANCNPGSYPQFLVPDTGFGAQVDDRAADKVRRGVILSGRSHKAVFYLVKNTDYDVSANQFVCTSYPAAKAAAENMEERSVKLSGASFSLNATDEPVLLATAYSPYWNCGAASTDGSAGFLKVLPKGPGPVQCSYQTPGWRAGLVVSLLVLVGLVGFGATRKVMGGNTSDSKHARAKSKIFKFN
ncbi:MAG: YfhO family protein [Actinomycetaceae bacterium]|nr:YfhO family protein [Actinomycetaceae bacterium]